MLGSVAGAGIPAGCEIFGGVVRWCRYAQPPANSLDACGMRFIEEIAGHWSLRYALLLKRLRNIGEIRGQDRLSLGIRTRRVHRN